MHIINFIQFTNQYISKTKHTKNKLNGFYRVGGIDPFSCTATARVITAELESMALRNVFEIAIWRMTNK